MPQLQEGHTAISGFLNINKPAGITSHDVVDILRKFFRLRRIGHAGTLDPCARGVLVMGIGRATKRLEGLQAKEKEYEAEITFGYSTDTQDFTGKKAAEKIPVKINAEEIIKCLNTFKGEIMQVVPAYSALHFQGKRYYEHARHGTEIPRKERNINIYEIKFISFTKQEPYPKAAFFVKCSKGTYVRTLCEDIGNMLGYPAHMSALTRLAVGNFRLCDAVTLDVLEKLPFEERCRRLIPLEKIAV